MFPTTSNPAHPAPHLMQCLEIWGGNHAIDTGVTMTGLDAWVFSRPFGGSADGGDLHYLSSCATGRITRVLVADVSGHGSEVAEIARSLRELMRRNINYVSQRRVIESLNREFTALSEAGRFATAVVATYFAPTDMLDICNAGHPRPMLYRAAHRAWSVLDVAKAARSSGGGRGAGNGGPGGGIMDIPLGIAEPTTYSQQRLQLARGDLLLLYTDSLVEARNAEGRMLGEAGLLEIVAALDAARPGEIVPELLRRVSEFAGGEGSADDMTVLLLGPNAIRPRTSIIDGLRTSARLSWELLKSLRPGGARFARPEATATNLLGSFFERFNRRGGGKS